MTDLIDKTDNFVLELFKAKLPNTYIFHNYNHTQRVVKSSKELIENSQLNVKEQQVILLAAWLHDTGYTVKFEGHEEESIKIATQFLKENNIDQETIEAVSQCILATKFDVEPTTELEKIIKDADCSHLAKDYFHETTEFLRQELQLLNIHNFTAEEWLDENIRLLT